MTTINWGIIGCGDVTEVKSGPAFNKVPDSSLVAIMRRDAVKAADYARRHGVPAWYASAPALLADPAVNAVYIATPPGSHLEYARLAFAAGKPVYMEKPMALTARASREMNKAASTAGLALSVAHYRKAQPRFRRIRELLSENAIGSVRMVNLLLCHPPPAAGWRTDPAISGGGIFHDLSPHQLDLMLYFFGDYAEAHGLSVNQAKQYPAPDLVTGTIVFNSGVIFTGSWCFTASAGEARDEVVITGSTGTIRFSTFSTDYFTISRNGKEDVESFPVLPHVQQPMIEAVVQYFLGRAENPSPPAAAIKTMDLIESFTR